MEFKKRGCISRNYFRLYIFAFLIYILIGLQPVEAISRRGTLIIPAIGLTSSVVNSEIKHGELETPENEVGYFSPNKNKTFLFGHSTTVFNNLPNVKIGDEISFRNKTYQIFQREVILKTNISMAAILGEEDLDTLIIMTCTGDLYDNGDASHRLIISAVAL